MNQDLGKNRNDVQNRDGGRVSEVLAGALKARRESLNSLVKQYRMAGKPVDGGAFQEHLAHCVDPIAVGVAELFPERIAHVVSDLFGVSLELFATALLGPEAKIGAVGEVWRQLLPKLPRLIARDPVRVAASLCNAVYNITAQPNARPHEWLQGMLEIGDECKDTKTLLDAGKVVAWRSGMVQYRSSSLQTARQLPFAVLKQLLNLASESTPEEAMAVLERLEKDPWLTVESASGLQHADRSIRRVGTVGAFRGFHGLFLRPPVVRCEQGRFRVFDGDSTWELLADAHGELLARCPPNAFSAEHSRSGPRIDGAGTVRWDSQEAPFPDLAQSTSSAWDGTTFAVTLAHSHHVFLIAMP